MIPLPMKITFATGTWIDQEPDTRRTFICWDPVSIYGSPSVFRRTVAVHRKTSADSERLYGILRADDAVVPYRLEMQARLAAGGAGDLYGYWKDAIYRELYRPDRGIREAVQSF